ncbi:hypothetical protein PPYR_10308 [Photinus pyralis]|uniref:Mpv17-like protein n=2 Tax=Photinus pyralis TaxID=7054 RepID=A0A5N4AFZ6_PHOPY|nr:mpv17-like protein [Photinus pyralis]KAB0796247.1 hypothetical protein PPYR_10308 [Photinus pyralis]
MWRQFKGAFTTRPILTNAVVYGTLYVGAEFSQQVLSRKVLSEKKEALDVGALKRYTLYGTFIQGPLLTVWYKWLDAKYIGTGLKIVGKKLLLDQFLLTPQIVWIFFTAMSIMEGKEDIFEECRSKFVPTFQSSCLFWLPAQSVNFMLIPPTFRVVYIGLCSFGWVNILCYIKRQSF